MTTRIRYKCVKCGLEVSGREGVDGKVYVYDRSADAPGPPRPGLCIACHEAEAKARAEK